MQVPGLCFLFQVNGTRSNKENPKDAPCLTGKAGGSVKHTKPSSNEFTRNSTDIETKVGFLIFILEMDLLELN